MRAPTDPAGGNDPTRPGSDTGPGDTRPYLCIPYWETPLVPGGPVDNGQQRPLPAGVVSWECLGVHPGPYVPGETLQMTVDVRNSGGGSATAVPMVVAYWGDPTVGFAHPTFLAAAPVAAPVMRDPLTPGFVSVALSGVIPATAPAHVCLLVCVTHSLDAAGTVANPVGDRHWAQHNIVAVSTRIHPIRVPFTVANPFAREGDFVLRVRTLDLRTLQAFARRRGRDAGQVQPRIQLQDAAGRPAGEAGREAQAPLTLRPHGRQSFSVVLEVDPPLPPRALTAVEAVLYPGANVDRPVGSLGIVLSDDPP